MNTPTRTDVNVWKQSPPHKYTTAIDAMVSRRHRFRLYGFFGGGLSDHDTASNAAKL